MERSRPVASFMAFGTKGDEYPIAALAAAFASNQQKYDVVFITHSSHQDLTAHFAEGDVLFRPVSSPPVLLPPEGDETDGSLFRSFCIQKSVVTREHRRQCLSIFERIFVDGPSVDGDFVLINFFALKGRSLAELFHVRCVVAASYVVHYTVPSSFERQFRKELLDLHKYLQQAPPDKLGWKDVTHWMWPLFSEDWGSWRKDELNLSALPFTDPVTGLPMWHDRPSAPLLLYGFSREVVECPEYWPSNTRVCGFRFLPPTWQFSCNSCGEALYSERKLCPVHIDLHSFLDTNMSIPLVFVGLSSAGSMGLLRNPLSLLCILQTAIKITNCRFVLLTAGFEQLNVAIQFTATKEGLPVRGNKLSVDDGVSLFDGRLFSFSGSMPYSWLFQKCAAVIHHGGSGSTAAALKDGIPQIICPLMADQFYWAERMCWLGVAPYPLKRNHLVPESCNDISIK
ncbi:sterol 3-beta-glucosyltransferase-like [Silene latifolia]|uniref:sterol 3-beta-glucosyltransferase-like n=1 Tax=Silene latifolia TaxID=37657 RepID=UPI003D76DFCC